MNRLLPFQISSFQLQTVLFIVQQTSQVSLLYCFFIERTVHSWFISVVDNNELCPVQPVQVNQSKYKNYENEGPSGAMIFFSITIHLLIFFFENQCAQLAVTVCCRCYKRSKKASKKALAHPKDHLERSLRPIQATKVTPEPLKRLCVAYMLFFLSSSRCTYLF